MATVIVTHRVKDYATWKPGFDNDRSRRDAAGIKQIAVGENAADPGMVYLIWEMPDPSIMEHMMKDEELQKSMAAAGVISKPEVIILN